MTFEFTSVETLIILQALCQMCNDSNVSEVDKVVAAKLHDCICDDVRKQLKN